MSNLTRFENNGLELIIDITSGEVFASQSAIARMCNVSEAAIRKFLSSNQIKTKSLQIPTDKGLRTSNLVDEAIIKQALVKYNPELLLQCVDAGLRIYLHGIAGFKYQVTQPHKIPSTYAEALLEAGRLALEKEKLEQTIEEQKPKVAFANDIMASDDCVTVGEYAKSIDMGRNKLFALLREIGIIQQSPSRLPYQRYIDSKCFEVTQTVKNNKTYTVALVTPKGQMYLHKRIDKYNNLLQTEEQIEDIVFDGIM